MRTFGNTLGLGRSIAAIAVAAFILNVVGCGSGVDDKFKGERGTVSGKVTFKGQPVPANSAVFFQSKEKGYSAGGKTNEKGEYTLMYDGSTKLPAVAYKVQIGPPPAKVETVDPAKVASGTTTDPVAPFPTKYTSHSTSGLEFTVKSGANTADFDLAE